MEYLFESCDASFNCKLSLADMKDGGRLAIELDNLDWDSWKIWRKDMSKTSNPDESIVRLIGGRKRVDGNPSYTYFEK